MGRKGLYSALGASFWPSLKRIFKTGKQPNMRFTDNHLFKKAPFKSTEQLSILQIFYNWV